MINLILPIGGKSSRFPPEKPKWYKKHPFGDYMLTEAISGLDLHKFDNIVIIGKSEHKEMIDNVVKEIEQNHEVKIKQSLLNKQTKSVCETIYEGLENLNITGAIFIKDCDGYFELPEGFDYKNNGVCVYDIHNAGKINAGNKSYVQLNNNSTVGNIIEKQVISNLFCVGGYYFTDSEQFKQYYLDLPDKEDESYISHIIYNMILDNNTFFATEVDNFKDWGTIEDWVAYHRSLSFRKSIVIDIDDTLSVTNSTVPYENRRPKQKVIDKLKEYQKNGFYIILYTARSQRTYQHNIGLRHANIDEILRHWLKKHNVPYNEIYYDKPWCGHGGFYVDDGAIRPKEFINKSYEEIIKTIKEDK